MKIALAWVGSGIIAGSFWIAVCSVFVHAQQPSWLLCVTAALGFALLCATTSLPVHESR